MINHQNICIMASGSGSTAIHYIQEELKHQEKSNVKLIITNNPSAKIITKIKTLNEETNLNIQIEIITTSDFTAEKKIINLLEKFEIDLIFLFGYLRKIGETIIEKYGYPNNNLAKIINTHPGLLPATKGLYGIKVQEYCILNQHENIGCTLHMVSKNYDEGPIIASHEIKMPTNTQVADIFDIIKILEKTYLYSDIQTYLKKLSKEQNE